MPRIDTYEIWNTVLEVKCKYCEMVHALPTTKKSGFGAYTVTAKEPTPCCIETKKIRLEDKMKKVIDAVKYRFHCMESKDPEDMGWKGCGCKDCHAIGTLHSLHTEMKQLLWSKN